MKSVKKKQTPFFRMYSILITMTVYMPHIYDTLNNLLFTL